MDIEQASDGLNNLGEWKVDERVKERVKGTGFDGLLRITDLPVNHDLSLLSALVESYDVNKRCFVFNNHNLVFGLEDILYMTGLPVDGNPVTGLDLKGSDLCMKYLGRVDHETKRVGATSLAWLRKNFEVVPESVDKDSADIEPYVRAFILYLIGSVVVPDNYGNNVPAMYLPLLENLHSIKDYAWGAALLAHLHVALENFKLQYSIFRKNILMGHTYSLVVFAMERIPKLLVRFCFNGVNPGDNYLPNEFPLLAGWTKLLCEPSDTARNITKQEYLQVLGELEEEDIVWQPYKWLSQDFLPQYCSRQDKMGKSRTIVLCFEKAAYHRPDLSPKQFGIHGVNSSMLRPLIELELRPRLGRKGTDWGTWGSYGSYTKEWENRASSLIIESDEDGTGSPSVDAPTTSSFQSCDDPLSAKRRRVDYVYCKLKTKDSSGTLVDNYASTNSVPSGIAMHNEAQLDLIMESESFQFIPATPLDDTPPASFGESSMTSDQEPSLCVGVSTNHQLSPPRPLQELETTHPSNTSSSLHFDSDLFLRASSPELLDELSSIEADVNDLLRWSGIHTSNVKPPNMQAAVESAKETIRGILCRGFDGLANPETQGAFLCSSEVLLSAGVFPSDLVTSRLTAFRNELPENATAFLQAQTDIDAAAELSSLQEFLKERTVKIPVLQERLHMVAEKIAHLRAILEAALEKQTKTNEVLAAFVEKGKAAEQIVASLNPKAAEIESKKRAAEKLVEQCRSSWIDLRTSLFRFL